MSTSKQYPEGLLGKKLGMTQVFTPEGQSIPVTISSRRQAAERSTMSRKFAVMRRALAGTK